MKITTTILVAVIVVLVGVIGYMAGKGNLNVKNPSNNTNISPTAAEPRQTEEKSTTLPSEDESKETPSSTTETVQAGGVTTFPKYTLSLPSSSWTSEKTEDTNNSQVLTLSTSTSKMTIAQGGSGGKICTYPDTEPFEGPSEDFKEYRSATTKDGVTLRYAPMSDGQYLTCEKVGSSWQSPTSYGVILFTTPKGNTNALDDVNAILGSLKKD